MKRLSSSQPKHQHIFKQLQNEIAAGKYPKGSRLPSESQLVKQFGVSRPTAARALRDLQHAGLVQRRAGSGSFVADKTVSEVDVRLLGLLIPGLGSTEIFEPICGEIASLARAHGYSLLWGSSMNPLLDTDSSREHAEQLCHQFIERKVAGVFFAPFELTPHAEEANRRLSELLRQAGIPAVLLDRDLTPFPRRSDFDLVGIDNFAGGFILAEHLIKLGCRKLAFVVRPKSAATVDARIAGVREALGRYKLKLEDLVRTGDPSDMKFVGPMATINRPDALICANDYTAAVLMRSLETTGVRVPRDVRVVGFDDVKYATLLSVPLTTIHQPCARIGVVAFQTLLSRIADPSLPARTVLLAPQLIVRDSCGAYPPRRG